MKACYSTLTRRYIFTCLNDKGSVHDYLQNYNDHLTIAGLMTFLPRRTERNDLFRTAASLIKRWVRDGVTLSHRKASPPPLVLHDSSKQFLKCYCDFAMFKFTTNKNICYEEYSHKAYDSGYW